MRPKSLALLLLALGCGLVASVGITRVMNKGNGEAEKKVAEEGIYVAAVDIPLGERLTAENTKVVQWPKDKTPSGAITKVENIKDRRVRTRLFAGEPILENRLWGKGVNEQGASAMIPIGYRVVPVKVDLVSGGSDLILPGDRVDVMIHLVRDPNRGIGETLTRTILQDIKVFAVNDVLSLDKDKDGTRSISAKTISLLVTPEQAAVIMLATQSGVVNLVMRSSNGDTTSAQVEARMTNLTGASSSADHAKEDSTDQVPTKQVAVTPLPVVEQPSPRDTWKVRVVKGNSIDEVIFEKDSGADPSTGSWRLASPANATVSPVKDEPKVDTPPVRSPGEAIDQAPPPPDGKTAKKAANGNGTSKTPQGYASKPNG